MKDRRLKNIEAEPTNANEWRNQAISRSNCYALLSVIFRDAPTSKIVSQLRTSPMTESFMRLGYDCTQDLDGELRSVTEHLGEQYTQSFVGPGPHVSLYASVHFDDDGQLWGDSTVWVKRFIGTTGLSFEGNWGGIPDHIAIELELMQRLTAYESQLWVDRLSSCSQQNENLDSQLCCCLRAQDQFLCDHLAKWIPGFYERVLETSSSLFYRKMAELAKLAVVSDVEHVAAAQIYLRCDSFS
jgi:TorA maturation chaperone TorD